MRSRAGLPTIKANADGREIWLHSPYDPVREAERWASGVTLDDRHVPVVVGLGLGYHVAELARRFPHRKMLVLEPVRKLYDMAISEPQVTGLLSNNDINLFVGDDASALDSFLTQNVNLYGKEELEFIEYPPLARFFREEFDQIERRMVDGLNTLSLSLNTTLALSKAWTDNFFANLPYIIDNPGVKELFGAFSGRPGVIVSAGPSLSNNIHLLKDVKGKGLIIVVGTAVKPVLQSGVIPDLVVTIDGSLPNYRHFEDLVTRDFPLAFYPSAYPIIISEHSGPLLTMNDVFFGHWLQKITGQDKGWISTGPSVANVSFDIAVQLGLNPIVFIGQDLAFTGGHTHASGTVYAKDAPDGALLEVTGINGGTVRTDRTLNAMRDWLNKRISLLPDNIEVINATEGGAKIEGTKVMTFREAIDRYFNEDFPAGEIIRKTCNNAPPLSEKKKARLIKTLIKARAKMSKISASASKGMLYAEKLKRCYEKKAINQSRVDTLLQKLDRVDEKIKKCREASRLLNLLYQPAQFRLEVSFEPADDESEKDKGRRLADKSQILYLGIKEAAEHAAEIIGAVVSKLDGRKDGLSGASTLSESIPALPGTEHSDRLPGQVDYNAL
ncbi:hypothetical protein A6M21_13500 [Desulfotomaculum copahuensis]|uniref:6-hydroxymethylpterin diphosphokinase MptE-like domain-containing protein n=1 Tax=Desulfotomaculum copahuensis TaxID=1838280 RepID=A0A1B7LCC7_9FIRM|nr:hypothetical protein A6M21_13500 [Desulfotomaculum copahuensis]